MASLSKKIKSAALPSPTKQSLNMKHAAIASGLLIIVVAVIIIILYATKTLPSRQTKLKSTSLGEKNFSGVQEKGQPTLHHQLLAFQTDRSVNTIPSPIQELTSTLFNEQNVWADAAEKADHGYPHTNLQTKDIERVLVNKKHKRVFWLEIGTMLGGSALMAARVAKDMEVDINVVCIDPFTGDVNMWEWEKDLTEKREWKFLGLKNGAPTIRQRFLANVIEAGLTSEILPIQTTGLVGMKLIAKLYANKRLTSLPDIIYVDSSHEIVETFLELQTAWSILEQGGTLMGDDLDWSDVNHDVYKFAESVSRNVTTERSQWFIQK